MIFSVQLCRLRFFARHGVFESESKVGNQFIVDFNGEYEVDDNFCSDQLSDTISYADVYELIKAEMDRPSALLEHVAARIIQRARKCWPLFITICVRIEKVRPPICGIDGNAAVSLKWEKQK